MKFFLIMIAVFFSINSLAARHKILKHYTSIIKRPDSVAVFTIGTYPVEQKAQDSNKKYVYEYPVINKIELPDESITFLKKTILQKSSYLTGAQKRCPFEGGFAIVFTKDKRSVSLIISPYPCSKTLVYLPGTATATPYDLAENNSIEKVLLKKEIERL